MAVENGTYELIWADNTSYAVDSYGAEDKSGVLTVLHPRNKTDAQFVQISAPNIWFPLTGMALDVLNAATSVAEGNTVNQFTPNGSKAQLWELVDTGSTKTVDGKSLTVYDLRLKTWTDKVLGTTETPGSGTGPGGTARLTMHTPSYSGFKHGFCLVKTNVLPYGTYEFRAYADRNDGIRIDVPSNTDGAFLRTWPLADDNKGIWGVSKNTDDETQKITNAQTGLVMDVQYAQPVSGQKVFQHSWNSGSNQRWLIIPYGTGNSNGLYFPVYKVRSKLGTNLVLDTTDAYPGDVSVPVRTETSNSVDQLFHMVPTEAYANDLPIPTSLHILNSNGASVDEIHANGTVTYTPSWTCQGTNFQLRYRIWTRDHNSSTLVASEWRDIQSEAGSNNGWGIIWEPNVVSTQNPRRTKSLQSVLSLSGNDRYDIEFEVRSFSAHWGNGSVAAHGGSASKRFVIAWKPTITLSDLTFSPEGIKLAVSSDLKRSGNSATVTIKGLVNSYSANSLNADDTIEIPLSELSTIPEENQTVIVSVGYTTADGAHVTKNEVMTVSYNTGHGMALSPTVVIDNDAIGHVTAPSGTKLWLVIHRGHGDRLVEVENLDRLLPPLGAQYRLFASVESGSSWGTWSKVFDPINESPAMYRWNWGSDYSDKATLAWNEGSSGPDFTPSYKADVTKHTTTGRERVVATFGSTVTSDLNVSGVLVDFYETPDGDYDAMDALAHCKQAVFRSPRGIWAQVAVEGLSVNASGKHIYDVSITQSEVMW